MIVEREGNARTFVFAFLLLFGEGDECYEDIFGN